MTDTSLLHAFNKGMILPTLIRHIQSILQQYPDDGQILKELIQNAEDAGAKRIVFMLDNTFHPADPDKLYDPELKLFQGPALYVYNDAVFSTEDWKGIRMLNESVKGKDPMKVGRFGLGFKSVFHMTDLPSICSGRSIGFIDPHEQFFKNGRYPTSSFMWHLPVDNESEVSRLSDQFEPFIQPLFGLTHQILTEKQGYNGTLFRFPFRMEGMKSDLCATVYSSEKAKDLFRSLEVDAHIMLLFLKSLELIEVYEKVSEHVEPTLLMSIRTSASSDAGIMSDKRQQLINEIKVRRAAESSIIDPISITYPMITQLTKRNGADLLVKTSQQWIISHYYGGKQDLTMAEDIGDMLGLLPWVATALPVQSQTDQRPPVYLEKPQGQIFCFLPLPLEELSPTGLQVHVHGYFAVDQNRRHLKTRSAGQLAERLTDKSLLWNEFLVSCLLPKAMINLALFIVSSLQQQQNTNTLSLSHDLIYAVIPDVQKVTAQWKVIADVFHEELKQLSVFYSRVDGGRFLQIKDALFDDIEDRGSRTELVRRIMLENRTDLVSAPKFVLTASIGTTAQRVTPHTVCSALKNVDSSLMLTDADRMMLLEYIVSDTSVSMIGAKLLPLADGSWVEFKHSNVNDRVFVDKAEHVRDLVPGFDKLFIKSEATLICQTLISNNKTQLTYLDQHIIAELLRKHIFTATLEMDHDADLPYFTNMCEEWFTRLWKYLSQFCPQDLSPFHNMHIVPVGSGKLMRLCTSNSVIAYEATNGLKLTRDMKQICRHLGVKVVTEMLSIVTSHRAVWTGKYLLPADILGVVTALNRLDSSSVVSLFVTLNDEQKNAARTFLLNDMSNADVLRTGKNLLQSLPMFLTVAGSGFQPAAYVSLTTVNQTAPSTSLPVDLPQQLLDVTDSQVISKLGIKQLTVISVLHDLVFPAVIQGLYTNDKVVELMQWVCSRWSEFGSNSMLVGRMKQLRFVPRENGQLVIAGDLFNIHNSTLHVLFHGDDVFPTGVFAEARYEYAMNQLGLKELDAVTATDVYQIAEKLNATSTDPLQYSTVQHGQTHKKSDTLLSFLESNSARLLTAHVTSCGISLQDALKTLQWVAVLKTRPERYPPTLKFAADDTGNKLARPLDVCSSVHCNLAGSIKMFVKMRTRKIPNIARCFDWVIKPSIVEVVNHLLNVIYSYTAECKLEFESILSECYKYLNEYVDQLPEVAQLLDGKSWIFNSTGFSTFQNIVRNNPFIDLQPHIFVLPPDLKQFTNLWKAVGIKDNCDLVGVLHQISDLHRSQTLSTNEISRDLQLSVNILNHLTSDGNKQQLDRDSLLIPVKMSSDAEGLEMRPIDECTYCDKEWYQQGFDTDDIDETDIHLVHPLVPVSTCEALSIHSIVSRLLDGEEMNIGSYTSYGQSEPLTRRLKNILLDYTDGLAVLKELIQNADDAGAREIKFLYDERENEDSQTKLIDRGMKELQGPALWAYNDATFSNNDFENLVKLSGATKEECKDKIGRFGLGFNAVYNLTDVPSLVSQNYLVFLDPHTTHLNRAIRDKNKPGIKLNLQTMGRRLHYLSNQFKPFIGIFDCDLSGVSSMTSFPGTLFRFPLRNQRQSVISEICNRHYDRQEMKSLLNLLGESADYLLLFTQNVQKVSVFHLSADQMSPDNMKEIFVITKHIDRVLRPLSGVSDPGEQCAILKRANSLLSASTHSAQKLESSLVLKVSIEYTENDFPLSSCFQSGECYWLVTSCVGQGKSLEMSRTERDLISAGGVATRLDKRSGKFHVASSNADSGGRLFCFLPLPVARLTHLPVHVNGFFAVTSSRMHLFEDDANDKPERRAVWNQVLMEDAVKLAYITAMEDVVQLGNNDIEPLFIWPVHKPHNEVGILSQLTDQLYVDVFGADRPKVLHVSGRNVSITECKMLEVTFRQSDIGKTALKAFQHVKSREFEVVDLPIPLLTSILQTSARTSVQALMVDKTQFYQKWFLPNIDKVECDIRDMLVISALFDDTQCRLLENCDCIPVLPNGTLRKPSDLIAPKSNLAVLFDVKDKRFPRISEELQQKFNVDDIDTKLIDLGMKNVDLCWQEIAERCEVANLSRKLSDERLKVLVDLMSNKTVNVTAADQEFIAQIRRTPFLPLLKKPHDFPLTWKCDECSEFTSCTEAYLSTVRSLVCCSYPVIDEFKVFRHKHLELKAVLKLVDKSIEPKTVVNQLDCLLKVTDGNGTLTKDAIKGLSHITEIYEQICDFFSKLVKESRQLENLEILPELVSRRCVLNSKTFMKPEKCAKSFPVADSQLLPYLSSVPLSLKRRHEALLDAIGVKQKFTSKDFAQVLQTMYDNSVDRPLSADDLKVVVCVINQCLTTCDDELPDDVKLYMPNTVGKLCPIDSLCFNNCQWIKVDDEENVCHSDILFEVAMKMQVKTLQQHCFMKNSTSIDLPFTISDKITTRLKNILSGYPSDDSILKELLQNADDVGATQIHFINDQRQLPDERVFQDSWKLLQGPALCVYNDKPFTDTDVAAFAGIQNIDECSGGGDPTKTGKFGVGFNCVYHVTDVPTFLTCVDGSQVFDMFDPSCNYVPGTTDRSPGRKMTNVQSMKKIFPDVFTGYFEDVYSKSSGTLLRLPLRTQDSLITDSKFTPSDITDLFTKSHDMIYESLLFLNSLEEIQLKQVGTQLTDPVDTTYTVKALLSNEAKEKRDRFKTKVGEAALQLRNGNVLLRDVGLIEETYKVITEDSKGRRDEWLIVQRFGCDKPSDVPNSLTAAHQDKEIGLLPRACVAYLNKTNDKAYRSKWMCPDVVSHERSVPERRLFCFLPMPVEIHTPVYINDHFALASEDQTGLCLWTVGGSCQMEWNNWLMECVVAPAYCTLVQTLQQELVHENITSIIWHRKYFNVFPEVTESRNAYVDKMSVAVYQRLQYLPVLPIQYKTNTKAHRFKWMCPVRATADVGNPGFFNNLYLQIPETATSYRVKRRHQIVEKILIDCGFLLFVCPMAVCKNFEKLKVPVKVVSPEAVLDLFATFNQPDTACLNGTINVPVQQTVFKDIDVLKVLLEYCSKAQNYQHRLIGLPLLVTSDQYLRVFDSNTIIFDPCYASILPHIPQLFLHSKVFSALKLDTANDKHLCRTLTVQDFVKHLPDLLPRLVFYGADKRVTLSELTTYIRHYRVNTDTDIWLTEVWTYLDELVKANERKLEPLLDWCLLPAVRQHTEILIPIRNSQCVIMSIGKNLTSLEKILAKLGVLQPKPNWITDIYMRLLGTVNIPAAVIGALDEVWKDGILLNNRLSKAESSTLLTYFSKNLSVVRATPNSIPVIQKLPCFCTVYQKLVHVYGNCVYVIPADIPIKDMNIWDSTKGTVFITEEPANADLLKYLGCHHMTHTELYCTFIFQQVHFEMLSPEGQQIHLIYVRDRLLPRLKLISGRKAAHDALLHALRQLKFIQQQDGDLACASEFYDCSIAVFREMLDESHFVPKAFRNNKWTKCLRECGMIHSVTQDMFISYAHKVAETGKTGLTEVIERQSQTLTEHLFRRDDILDAQFLQQIRCIAFLVPHSVGSKEQLHQQHGNRSEDGHLLPVQFAGSIGSSHADFVWSAQCVLPASSLPCSSYGNNSSTVSYVHQELQIDEKPKLQTVAQHTMQLCNRLEPTVRQMDPMVIITLGDLLKCIYRTLQLSLPLHVEVELLKITPCVIDVKRQILVRPCQIVIRASEADEIFPHLVCFPLELGLYQSLFRQLGASESPTVNQYAMVLRIIADATKCKQLDPNELTAVHKAMEGIFELLGKYKAKVDLTEVLYLLGVDGQLHKSSDIIFDNTCCRHLLKKFDKPLLAPLRKHGMLMPFQEAQELLSRLPAEQQPPLLSTVVHEMMDANYERTDSQLATTFQRKLHSDEFKQLVIRIALHNLSSSPEDHDSKIQEIISAAEGLKTIEFVGVTSLSTYMVHKGVRITETEKKKSLYICCEETDEASHWMVYICEEQHITKSVFHMEIAELINKTMKNSLKSCLHYLVCIIDTPDFNETRLILDTMRVSPYPQQEKDAEIYTPVIGMFVPLKLHCRLRRDIELLQPDEFIALETDDPAERDEPGQPTYVLVQIIELVTNADIPADVHYKIRTKCSAETVVSAVSLYAFVGESADGDDDSTPAMTLDYYDDITRDLKTQLTDTWKMSLTLRNQVVKRMIRLWHPNVNQGCPDLAMMVTQFILKEIELLDQQLATTASTASTSQGPQFATASASASMRSTSSSSSSSITSFGQAYYNYLTHKTPTHRQQRQKYQQNYRQNTTNLLKRRKENFFINFYCGCNSQPGEGRRWLRQAEFDVLAAGNDEGCGCCNAFDWACLKYYQAAANALRGVQYARDANRMHDLNVVTDIRHLTRDIEDSAELRAWVDELQRLLCPASDSVRMLYPGQHCSTLVPRDVYTQDTAKQAQSFCQQIVNWSKQYIECRCRIAY